MEHNYEPFNQGSICLIKKELKTSQKKKGPFDDGPNDKENQIFDLRRLGLQKQFSVLN